MKTGGKSISNVKLFEKEQKMVREFRLRKGDGSLALFVLPVTPFIQNCTFAVCTATNKCAVFDPGGEVDKILKAAKEIGCDIDKILVTHGHLDHMGGAMALKKETEAVLLGPHSDDIMVMNMMKQLFGNFAYYGYPEILEPFCPDGYLNDKDKVSVGNIEWEVIHCPGHTPGHLVYYNKKNSFAQVGDVLFNGSVGRTDLPGSSHADLINSITKKLWPLGDLDFIPGHGEASTFSKERAGNPFVGDYAVM